MTKPEETVDSSILLLAKACAGHAWRERSGNSKATNEQAWEWFGALGAERHVEFIGVARMVDRLIRIYARILAGYERERHERMTNERGESDPLP